MKMTDLDEGIMKSLGRAVSGWNMGPAENKPKDVVKRNKNYDDETTKMLHKTAGGPEHSPAGLQKRVLDREMKKRNLSELSKGTLSNYSDKADMDVVKAHRVRGPQAAAGDNAAVAKTDKRIDNRMAGIDKAAKRLNKVDEVTLGNYSRKAKLDQAGHAMSKAFGNDQSPEAKAQHQHKMDRREVGLGRAKARSDKYIAAQRAKHDADAETNRLANRDANRARLAQLEKEFDPNYQYIDAPSGGEWQKHHNIAQQIAHLKHAVRETATAGATSAANVGVGAVYKNKPVSQPKNKDGTAKNALDMKSTNLLTGGSIAKR